MGFVRRSVGQALAAVVALGLIIGSFAMLGMGDASADPPATSGTSSGLPSAPASSSPTGGATPPPVTPSPSLETDPAPSQSVPAPVPTPGPRLGNPGATDTGGGGGENQPGAGAGDYYAQIKASSDLDPTRGHTVFVGEDVTYTVTVSKSEQVTSVNEAVVTNSLRLVETRGGKLLDTTIVQPAVGRVIPEQRSGYRDLVWRGVLNAKTPSVTFTYKVKANEVTTPDKKNELLNIVSYKETTLSSVSTIVESEDCVAPFTMEKTAKTPTGADKAAIGDVIVYMLTARKTRPGKVDNVLLRDEFDSVDEGHPERAEYTYNNDATVIGNGTAQTDGTGPFVWATGSLDDGSSTLTLQFSVTVKTAGKIGNSVSGAVCKNVDSRDGSCDDAGGDYPWALCAEGKSCYVTVTVVSSPFRVIKEVLEPAGGGSVRPGGLIHYKVTVKNTSKDWGFDSIDLRDHLAGDGARREGERILSGEGAGEAIVDAQGDLVWTTGEVFAQQEVRLEYWVRVDKDTPPEAVNNTITVASGDKEFKDGVADASKLSTRTEVKAESYWVAKSVQTPDGGKNVRPGQEVQYTLELHRQEGAADEVDAGIEDDLSAVFDKATYVPGSLQAQGAKVLAQTMDEDAKKLVGHYTLDKDHPTATVTYRVKISQDAAVGGELINQVTATETEGRCAPGNDCRTVTHIVGSFTVEKSAKPSSVVPGAALEYTVVLKRVKADGEIPAGFEDDLRGVVDNAKFLGVQGPDGQPAPVLSDDGKTLSFSGLIPAGVDQVRVSYQVQVNAQVRDGSSLVNHVSPLAGTEGECLKDKCVTTTPITHEDPTPGPDHGKDHNTDTGTNSNSNNGTSNTGNNNNGANNGTSSSGAGGSSGASTGGTASEGGASTGGSASGGDLADTGATPAPWLLAALLTILLGLLVVIGRHRNVREQTNH